MKFNDKNNFTDNIKFNSKSGIFSIKEECDSGNSFKKAMMFFDPLDVDALIEELKKFKIKSIEQ